MTRFDLDMDGSMEPSEHGRWVRYEDAQQEPVKSGGGASATVTITLPAQQEPVAYLCENAVGHKYFRWKKPSSTYKPIALYTSPPAQRTWVGLTDEELYKVFPAIATYHEANKTLYRSIARAIEAKLKEKNT